MDILSWILFGIIIGIVANTLDEDGEIIGWMGMSTLGTLVGGLIGSLVFKINPLLETWHSGTFVVSIVFSILLILIMETNLDKFHRDKIDNASMYLRRYFHPLGRIHRKVYHRF